MIIGVSFGCDALRRKSSSMNEIALPTSKILHDRLKRKVNDIPRLF